MLRTTKLLFLLMFFGCALLHAQDFFSGEFWTFSEPSPGTQTQDNLEEYRQTIITMLREEAVLVFSAMLYGVDFEYNPGSKARGIPETLETELRFRIQREEALVIIREYQQEGLWYMQFRYDLSENELARLRSWRDSNRSGGYGSHPLEKRTAMLEDKQAVIRDGMRSSILKHLQRVLPNRPRKVTGTLLLRDVPHVVLGDGAYHSTVKSKIKLHDVQGFNSF